MAVSEEECSAASSQSSSYKTSKKNCYLAKCVLKGSAVLQVLSGHIRSPYFVDVVFGKETSIELVIVGEDGVLQSVCEQPVFGTIKDLSILRWSEKFHVQNPQMYGKDMLVAISDSGKLSILSFCNEMHRFFPVTQIQLSNPGNARDRLGRMLAVDCSGCFIAASAYEDRVALFSVSMSAGSDIIDKKICYPSEDEGYDCTSRTLQKPSISGTIWGMCFISKDPSHPNKENSPVLAILLNRRGASLNELLLLGWNTREHAIFSLGVYVESGPLALNVVEVPHAYGFAFLFRLGDALLLDLRDPSNPCCVYRTGLISLPTAMEEQNVVEEPCRVNDGDDEGLFEVLASALLELGNHDPMCIDGDSNISKSASTHVCSWCWEPNNDKTPRMIYCLDTGEIYMIDILFDSEGLKVKQSDCLYKGQPCKELLYVEGGLLVAHIDMGDGMVLKLDNRRLLYTSPIQNIAPILDMAVVNCHDEKHDQMFACCGIAPEGSLRVIRSGISVEKLLKTPPIYQGITGTWTVRMKVTDPHHSFLVLSFVEETRVLSVGLSFTDVTDSVGFQPYVCTLACGLVSDGLLVQIHQNAVRLCIPTEVAHPEGISLSSPVCTTWYPKNMSISLGAVGNNMIVVSTSNPCFLFVLGVRNLSSDRYEIFELQYLKLQNELSCISIPKSHLEQKHLSSSIDYGCSAAGPTGVDIGNTFVIGTHRPSVEVLSFIHDKGLRILASGTISLTSTAGTAISGCIPQDVRLVLIDRLYVLAGLRNGMLLRFEWPLTSSVPSSLPSHSSNTLLFPSDALLVNRADCTSSFARSWKASLSEKMKDDTPVNLQLIAVRRIGITPVFLVPLSDSMNSDIIALSDRPWLLHTARHSLSYTSISFQASTHVTPVCTTECPAGILFVAENSLNLVEMVHSKLIQKFHLGGTPKKVLYHSESRLLLVMRTGLGDDTCSSDICCIDPLSGSLVSSFKFELGETGKSMALVRVGSEQVLVVGTSLSSGPAIMPSGEAAESTKGRLMVLCLEHTQHSDSASMTLCSRAGSSSHRSSPFREIVGYATEQLSSNSLCSSPDDGSCDGFREESEAWQLRLAYSATWRGMVLSICPFLDRYFVASAGNSFYVCGFPNDNPQRVKRHAVGRTRFMITTLTAHFTTIAVGDCRDGVLFYAYQEDNKKLEQLYSDPSQRLVADCVLMDANTAIVSDRKGSIAVLSSSACSGDNASPESNLTMDCAYYMGEVAISIRKGSISYKLPTDDVLKNTDGPTSNIGSSNNSIIVSTLLGSIIIFIPITREEYDLLEALQARLVVHPLTAPILGNDHNEFRSRENPVGVPKILDGDMLAQFLELTSIQQEAVLSLPLCSPYAANSNTKPPITVNQVVQLLERVHYALN